MKIKNFIILFITLSIHSTLSQTKNIIPQKVFQDFTLSNFYCEEGKYGSNCEKECKCGIRANNNKCGKFTGKCSNCKFGHFGNNCEKICKPRCKTNLCCIIDDNDFQESTKDFKLEQNLSKIQIKIGDKNYNIAIDYKRGYPLTLFKGTVSATECPGIESVTLTPSGSKSASKLKYNYSDFETEGYLYNDTEVIFENNSKKNLKINLLISESTKCKFMTNNKNNSTYSQINGVIGMGFFNSISESLFKNEQIVENIVSYEIKENKNISISFGNLIGDELKYLNKLSSCKAIFESSKNTYDEIQKQPMRCQIEGMKSSDYKNALLLNNTYMTLSLNDKSQFVLKNNSIYIDYITNFYFDEDSYKKIVSKENNNLIYCYQSASINKLYDFGFVMNKYFYSFKPNYFFVNSNECPKDYSKFIIEFSDTVNNSEIIIGKDFLEETIFTIDNEEETIYFYTRNAEYFRGEKKESMDESGNKKALSPLVRSSIAVVVVFFLNSIYFGLYYCCKKRRLNKEKYY